MTEPPRFGPEPAGSRRPARISVRLCLGFVILSLALWARGLPTFVAWEAARDHDRCFRRTRLDVGLWSGDPRQVAAWLESRGTPSPPLPSGAEGLPLVGARYCLLLDRVAAHVYYAGQRHRASVFVLSGPARISSPWDAEVRRDTVRLLRSAGRTVVIVGEREEDVATLAQAFELTVARRDEAAGIGPWQERRVRASHRSVVREHR